jgi:hypothetical protein
MAAEQLIGEAADHSDKDLGARQLLDHALAGPLPLLQEDQEIEAISCPSGLSWSCRMTSARTSLGEVRTRR